MRTIPTALAAHLDQDVTSLATVWKIIRQDGEVFRMTDCDVPLSVNGETYSPVGYSRSAVDTELGLRSDNMTVNGFFDDTTITREDIDNGLFDFAELRIWIVNHLDTSQGVIALMRGKLGEFEHTEQGLFNATWRSLAEAFRAKLGDKISATCRTDVGTRQCSVPIQPDIIQRGRQYAEGDWVRVITDADGIETTSIPFSNPGFESALAGSWSVDQGFVYRATSSTGITPYEGTYYLRGDTNGALNEVSQSLDIETDMPGVDLGLIDTGRATISMSIRALSDGTTSVHKGRVVFETLDAQGETTAILLDTGYKTFYPQRTWVEQGITDREIPSLTRSIKVTLWMLRESGLDADIGFDGLQGQITTYENGYGFQSSFENRIYECTVGGVTAAAEPTYDTTVGNDTADGTATFTAQEAFTRHATVTSVSSRSIFAISVVESRAADRWFNDGVVTIEDGDNRGRSIEVKSWSDAGNVVTVFLPFAHDMQIGDRLRISPGCDKTRPTCRDKWAIPGSVSLDIGNVKNMRAEPMVPLADTLEMQSISNLRPRVAASQ